MKTRLVKPLRYFVFLLAVTAGSACANEQGARWHKPLLNQRQAVYFNGPALARSTAQQARWIVRKACRHAGARRFRRVRDLIYALDVVLRDPTGKTLKERTEHFHYLKSGRGRDEHLARIVRTRDGDLEVLSFDGVRCWSSLRGNSGGRKGSLKAEDRLSRTVFWQLLPFRLLWPDVELTYVGAAPVGKTWTYEIHVRLKAGALHRERFAFFIRFGDYRLVRALQWKPGQPQWAPIRVDFSNYVSTGGIFRPRLLRFENVEGQVREVHLERLNYNAGQCWRLFAPPPKSYGGPDERLPGTIGGQGRKTAGS